MGPILFGDVCAFVCIKGQWPARAVTRCPVPATQSYHRDAYLLFIHLCMYLPIYLRQVT